MGYPFVTNIYGCIFISMQWFRLAAEQRLVLAQYNLRWMYSEGLEVEQNYKQSIKWWRLAAEQGLARAQEALDLFLERKI